jgi:tRNA/rRNA methyltransferase
VLLLGYEWFKAGDETAAEVLHVGRSRPATQAEFERFFDHLEEELILNGFLRDREKRPSMVRNLRSLFLRAQCTEQELRTLHGVVTAFAGPRRRPKKKAAT